MIKLHKNLLGKLSVASLLPAILMLGSGGALAQLPGNDAATMYVMVKLFGSHTAFASKAEMHVLDKSKKETDTLPMKFALLDGRSRMDIDVSQIRSVEMPAELLPSLKQMGMEQMTVITRPDKKIILSCYPRMKAYVETPMTTKEETAAAKAYKTEKTKLGKETIDGHPCEKNKVVLTDSDPKGEKYEATVWNATDLKEFPVQMQIRSQDSTVVMKFKDVKLGNPGASQFEAPAGMTRYTDATKLLAEATAKMTGGGK
ncbi:MAG TPA: DUF4412 domain-containing protein [Verrucomicrobiae bacterium]|nr:DUF4412 domain-containing protein [Verrucomicrobiae bacterium]